MPLFVLMMLLPLGMALFIGLRSVITGVPYRVPPWTKQIILIIMLLGALTAGTVGPKSWLLVLGHLLATVGAFVIGLRLFSKRHRSLWVALMFAPIGSFWVAQYWVIGQSLWLSQQLAPMIAADVASWNQQASVDVELPREVRSHDIRVYRSWTPTKRIGLLNNQQQIEFVIDIKNSRIVDVIRVNYLTSGDQWVWPSLAA
ncbi:MAG: hypothetical protein AAFY17_09450 [Cyanobacteria bacterium J06642_11]